MAESVKVVVDAMGGDLAPVEPVKAAVEAASRGSELLVGTSVIPRPAKKLFESLL